VVKGTIPEEYYSSAPLETSMGQVYSETILGKPSAYEETFLAANERLYSEPNTALFGSFLTYYGQWNLKPLMNFEEATETHLGFALQKDSELKPMLDFHITKMVESGVINALKRCSKTNRSYTFNNTLLFI